MKIALVSDLHFGVKKSSPELLEKFLVHQTNFFDKLFIPTLKEHQVKKIFILGDFFDDQGSTNVLVKNTVIKILETLLKELPETTISFINGNHEIYYKNTLEITSLKMFKHFDPRVEIITQIKPMDIDGCKTLIVPWIIKDSYNWKKFFEIIKKCKDINKKHFDLCLGHFEINGFEMIPDVIEDKGINQDEFALFGAVYSGHFHLRRSFANIQYLGCPYEITANDYGDTKGFDIFDTTTKTSVFIENNISPKHKQIKLSSLLKDESLYNEVKNNFVKLQIDTVISATSLLEIENKVNGDALKYERIDETSGGVEEVKDDVIKEDIRGNALAFLNEYYDNLELPEHINSDEFKKYMNRVYTTVEKEE